MARDVTFRSRLSQIGNEWDKSDTFQGQFSVFGAFWLILKISWFFISYIIIPMWPTFDPNLTSLLTAIVTCEAGMVGLIPKWVRLAPNGTNPGLFQIRFQCIWRGGANCTEIWSEKVPDLSQLGQSDPLCSQTTITDSNPRINSLNPSNTLVFFSHCLLFHSLRIYHP